MAGAASLPAGGPAWQPHHHRHHSTGQGRALPPLLSHANSSPSASSPLNGTLPIVNSSGTLPHISSGTLPQHNSNGTALPRNSIGGGEGGHTLSTASVPREPSSVSPPPHIHPSPMQAVADSSAAAALHSSTIDSQLSQQLRPQPPSKQTAPVPAAATSTAAALEGKIGWGSGKGEHWVDGPDLECATLLSVVHIGGGGASSQTQGSSLTQGSDESRGCAEPMMVEGRERLRLQPRSHAVLQPGWSRYVSDRTDDKM